jgi:hypothetical protein
MVLFIFYCCAGWEYIVGLMKVLTMYQVYHTGIHPSSPPPSPSSSPHPIPGIVSIYIHVYTVFAPHSPSYTLSLLPHLSHWFSLAWITGIYPHLNDFRLVNCSRFVSRRSPQGEEKEAVEIMWLERPGLRALCFQTLPSSSPLCRNKNLWKSCNSEDLVLGLSHTKQHTKSRVRT